ncbi:thioredoxin [Lewinellaceae bacterium SD302]|nr:thioredoxin [Lewinellaceae bacterium SD302]
MKSTLLSLFLLLLAGNLSAQSKFKKPAIKWYTWTEAIAQMEKDDEPKKIMVDLYTEWCGYCKKMDRETFTDPVVVKYVNEHFYPVKFDAEQKGSLIYAKHTFKYDPDKGRRGVHALAFALTDGRMSYPSMVYLDENQKRIAISPGFKPGDSFMTELRYFGDNHYKVIGYEEYKKKAGRR